IISCTVKKGKIIHDLKIVFSKVGKEITVDNRCIIKFADYISNLAIILFTPDDLDIIKGTPSLRRNLLNMELSQLSSKYLKTYNEYNKLLKTRNEYLKILYLNNIADKNYLDILTDKLIEKAIIIYQIRKEHLDKINKSIGIIYDKITGISELNVEYITNINLKSYTTDEIKSTLAHKFAQNYYKELTQGMTLFGPHRDDFIFSLQNNDIKIYGSEGQKRLALIAYKLATIPIFKEKLGTEPILLLDDIFSEIDKTKQNKLLKYIENDMQCIITTTSLVEINKKYLNNAKIFKIQNGIVSEERGE
ncbi:MAG: DNA replication and repair protein RecF, partial [Bacilli bacterium]